MKWILCLCSSAMLLQGAWAEDASPPIQGMLLLHNGQVLEGKISQVAGSYIVELPGGQIRMKNADVDMVCNNLEEAYQRKRTAIQMGDVHQHIELAQWCLRHKLLEPAASELAEAINIDPKNPMIGVLQHRLELAKEPPLIAEAKTSQPTLTNDELDRMVRGLPHGSVESFTQSVQPVLMNHCMSSDCHGSQIENGLQLFRISSSKTSSRRLTQRNLNSMLQYVDRENPAESRILKAIGGPHGTVQGPIFPEHQAAQYQRIADWINIIAYRPQITTPASVTPPVQENPSFTSSVTPSATPPGVLSSEARKAQPIRPPNYGRVGQRDDSPSSASEQSHTETTAASHNQPADPFDPEAFNRLQAAKK